MKKLIQKQQVIQQSFTTRCIMVKNIVASITTDYFLLLSEKLDEIYPLHPADKEAMLLTLWNRVKFNNVDECKSSIDKV